MRSIFLALAAMVLLSGCDAMLSERPLFSPDDQSGPPPLMEGVWAEATSTCTPQLLRGDPAAAPDGCTLLDVRLNPDGAWIVRRIDTAGADDEEAVPIVIVPAVERAVEDRLAPLYVIEIPLMERAHPDHSVYAFIAPLGEPPATEIYAGPISCRDALRDGPLDGVLDAQSEPGRRLGACVATSQAGVRAAARRAAIEQIAGVDGKRYIFLRR